MTPPEFFLPAIHYKKIAVAAICVATLFYFFNAQSLHAADCAPYPSPHQRFGINVVIWYDKSIDPYDVSQLNAAWYIDYLHRTAPSKPAGMDYVQMIRAYQWRSSAFTQSVTSTLTTNPGALWLVGNEPDRHGQDGLTPEEFAAFYHDAYTLLKAADPSSRVAVGGVVQGTPIRLRYLDMVLEAYRNRYGSTMPVEIWTTHGFILPECNTAGCWGASIPPGLEQFASEGKIYGVEDHGDIEVFKEHIIDFRRWMAERGYRQTPLLVTEYGILLPPVFGYGYPVVRDYMLASFDFLLNSKDELIGYPADKNRLVQSWSWYSLNHPPYDLVTKQGFNGNLFNPTTKLIEPLGQDFAAYVANHRRGDIDVEIAALRLNPPVLVFTDSISVSNPITLDADLFNHGGVVARNLKIRLWLGDPQNGGTLLAQSAPAPILQPACSKPLTVQLQWQPQPLASGIYRLFVDVMADNLELESQQNDNQKTVDLIVLDRPFAHFVYLPIVGQHSL
jgi:hypothetical protein